MSSNIYEFITIGGGEIFVDFFNGVASLVKSDNYMEVIRVSMLISAFWILLEAAFTNSIDGLFKQALIVFVTTQVLLYPTVSIHVTDKTDLDEIEKELIEPDELALFDSGNKLKAHVLGVKKCLL
jgi:hypothetical protein